LTTLKSKTKLAMSLLSASELEN